MFIVAIAVVIAVVIVAGTCIIADFRKNSKLVRTNQNRSGKTSVDRSAKTTLSTYNAWIYLSQLRTIHHIYTYACLIVYTTCSGRVVSQAKGPSLKLPSLVEAVTNNT